MCAIVCPALSLGGAGIVQYVRVLMLRNDTVAFICIVDGCLLYARETFPRQERETSAVVGMSRVKGSRP